MSYAIAQTPAPAAAAQPDQAPANAQAPVPAKSKPPAAPAKTATPAAPTAPAPAKNAPPAVPAAAGSAAPAKSAPPAAPTAAGSTAPDPAAPANPAAAKGNELKLAPDAPDQYTVVKGDTLWDISAKFLQQPWRWPEIWNINKEQVNDPHWIYPGQVLFLIMTPDGPRLVSGKQIGGTGGSSGGAGGATSASGGGVSGAGGATGSGSASGDLTIVPKIYTSPADQAIPSIPQRIIDPFLTQQLVVDQSSFGSAARVVGGSEGRFMASAGDLIYVLGITADSGNNWNVYRTGRILTDPDNGAVIGQEADYLGSAVLVNRGETGQPSILRVTKSREEISANDYLLPATQADVLHYVPHAVPQNLQARVVSIAGGASAGAQLSVITINRGKTAGVELGHVFALYRTTPDVENFYRDKRERVAIKDQRYGLIFVFRVLDTVSYALVMHSDWPVSRGDRLLPP